MVRQVDRIRRIINRFDDENLFDTNEIAKQTDFPRASIRRVLGSLAKTGEIQRIEPGLFQPRGTKRGTRDKRIVTGVEEIDEPFRRKFIGTQKYKNNPRQFFAITFEDNEKDREEELLDALADFLNSNYIDSAGNTGYSDDVIDEASIDFNILFPRIQVGEL